MRPPRGLTAEEAALWQRLAATVKPLHPRASPVAATPAAEAPPASPAKAPRGRVPTAPPAPPPPEPRARALDSGGLDGGWERRLARGSIVPNRTIDLHGLTLDRAHAYLDSAIGEALVAGARVILLIAGKPRPHDAHDQRGARRGAIRAKLLDWLAASRHASSIAAVRPAQPRHGGAGAVYLILRRPTRR